MAVPTLLKRVIACGVDRLNRPAARSDNSPLTEARSMIPRDRAPVSSPDSLRAPARVSTYTSLRATASSSTSRISGVKAPTRSKCWPGFNHAPRTSGCRDSVAQLTMSAHRVAASRSATGSTDRAPPASDAARSRARPTSRPQMRTSRIGRTNAWLAMRWGTSLPVPTMSKREAWGGDKWRDASADAALVRRRVSSLPSRKARGCPLVASSSR